MSRRLAWVGRLTALLAVVAALPATTASAGSPSHAQFVARADAICAKSLAKGEAKAKARPAPKTTKDLAATLDEEITILRAEIKATLALPAPTADQPLIHKAMNDLSQVLTLLEQAENGAAANNQPSILANLTKATVLHANAKTIARRLGLTVCGK